MFCKLDLKEDALRQRLLLLSNPTGSVHEEATRRVEINEEVEEESQEANIPLTPSSTAYGGTLSGDEISLDSDDLAEGVVSMDQDHSTQLLSLQCSLVVLAHTIPGTLVFTKSTLTFTAEDNSEEYKKATFLV